MNFAEAVQSDPPRLTILFNRGVDGAEQFQWGVAGKIPVLSLIGAITQAQSEIVDGAWMPECDHGQPALVAIWDEPGQDFTYYLHPDIPKLSLVGMLEIIKAMIVDSRLAQMAAANVSPLVGPSGQPLRRTIG